MNGWLGLIGIGLLLGPGGLAMAWHRVDARAAVRLIRLAVGSGLGLLTFGLFATSAPIAMRAVGLTRLALICERVFEDIAVGGPAFGTLSGLALVLLVGRLLFGWRRAARAQAALAIEDGIGARVAGGGFEVVVLPVAEVFAYAVPARIPQLVLTTGLWRALSRRQRRAVIAHELGHIQNRHWRDLNMIGAIDAAVGWVPGVGRSLGVWRQVLESWADDIAAEQSGGPDTVRSVLAVLIDGSPAGSLAIGGLGRVRQRLAHLDRCGQDDNGLLMVAWVAVVAPLVIAGRGIAVWAAHTHAAVTGIVYCPF